MTDRERKPDAAGVIERAKAALVRFPTRHEISLFPADMYELLSLAGRGAEIEGATEAWCVERENYMRAGFDYGTLYANRLHGPIGRKMRRVMILPAEKETP